jgi:anti-sigma28 factor (negative regulator of flagellin synthesis)
MNMKRITLVAIFSVAACTAWAGTKRIQCWQDNHGQRVCGDSVPPEDSSKERNVFDEQGRMVETRPRAPTPAEQVAAEKARAAEAERAKQAERQHAYDRYLLESYQNVQDLEQTRDQRLKALEVRMELVKKAIASGQQNLDALVARKQELQRQGQPIDKGLEAQLKDARRASIENPKALEALNTEHTRIQTQFDADIARYQLLKEAAAAQQPPPMP